MATRIWNSTGSTDMNLADNYDGSGALLVNDDLVFNNTSVIDAMATSDLKVGSIVSVNGFTGEFNQGGFTFTINGLTSLAGSSTVLDSVYNSGGNLIVVSASKNVSSLEAVFTSNGNFNINNKNIRKITVKSGVTVAISCEILKFASSDTVILLEDNTSSFNAFSGSISTLSVDCNGSCTPFVSNGGSINFRNGYQVSINMNGAYTITIQDLLSTGYYFSLVTNTASGISTWQLGSNINAYRLSLHKAESSIPPVVNFNTLNYNLNLIYIFAIGNTYGHNKVKNINFGSGSHSMAILTNSITPTTTINLNLASCNLNITGSQTFSSTGTLNLTQGTSKITFDGTGNQNLTTNGNGLYNIELSNNGGGLTLQDNLTCNKLIVENGDFKAETKTITTNIGFIISDNMNDIIEIDESTIIVLLDGDFKISSTYSSLSANNLNVDVRGDGLVETGNLWGSKYIKDLTCAYTNKTTQFGIGGESGKGILGKLILNGGTFKTMTTFNHYTSSPTPIVYNGISDIFLERSYILSILSNNVTLPKIYFSRVYNHITTFQIKVLVNSNINMNGDITLNQQTYNPDATMFIENPSDLSRVVNFNTNGYKITAPRLVAFCTNSSGNSKMNLNLSTSEITLGRFYFGSGNNNNNDDTIDLDSSHITITQDFIISKFSTVQKNSPVLDVVGSLAETEIDINGKSLGLLTLNKTSGIVKFSSSSSFKKYNFAPNTIAEFDNISTHTLDTYTTGDIDGSDGNLVTLKSDVVGQQWNFVNPQNMNVSYVNVQDSNATYEVIARATNNNIDSGNNINWTFADTPIPSDLPIITIDNLQYKIIKQTGSYGNWLMIAINENDELVVLKQNRDNEFITS